MSGRRLCFVCAPFGGWVPEGQVPEADEPAPTPQSVRTQLKAQEAINVNRACFVGHILWKHRHYAPIVPHAIGTMVFGDDHDSKVRERSIESGEVMARAVAKVGGSLFLLKKDDCTVSEGCRREFDVFAAILDALAVMDGAPLVTGRDWLQCQALDTKYDQWSVAATNDPYDAHHLVWTGTFAAFLDSFAMPEDIARWEETHGPGTLGLLKEQT